MRILTEADLRSALLPEKRITEYRVNSDVFVTELAHEYLRDHGIKLIREGQAGSAGSQQRPYTHLATGLTYEKKPPRMTHLRGNQLVPKTDKRILLRGRLDSLQGDILLWQSIAAQQGYAALAEDLGQLLAAARDLLAAEVCGRPARPLSIAGMDQEELHYASHHPEEYFGLAHGLPDHRNGLLAAGLNQLRTRIREVELTAEQVFELGSEHDDIIQTLNRLSSGAYVLYCSLLAGKYQRG